MKINITAEEAYIIMSALEAYNARETLYTIPENVKVMREDGLSEEEINAYRQKMKKRHDKRTAIKTRMYYEVVIPSAE